MRLFSVAPRATSEAAPTLLFLLQLPPEDHEDLGREPDFIAALDRHRMSLSALLGRHGVLRSWKNWEWMAQIKKAEDLDGRTNIVHQHFKELFTDLLQKAIPEWIWQRWPHEVLQSLPTIDSERVRDAAYSFRKRTSCADDHLVIEMLRAG